VELEGKVVCSVECSNVLPSVLGVSIGIVDGDGDVSEVDFPSVERAFVVDFCVVLVVGF